MNTAVKVAWGDRVALTDGTIGQVVEFDSQPPYTIKIAYKDQYSGNMFTKWIRTEQVEQVMPKR
jgi:preprotein translocase subunit YajC